MTTRAYGFGLSISATLVAVACGTAGCGSPTTTAPAASSSAPAPAVTAEPTAPHDVREGTEIQVVYSSEQKTWIEGAATAFARARPEIRVTLTPMGSLDAMHGILDGKLKPTVLSMADTMVQSLLASDYKTASGRDLFASSGPDVPEPSVLSPLVFVAWEDRGAALAKAANGPIGWRTLHAGATAPEGWPAVGGKPAWGFVKIGHADPVRSNSGLQALYAMTLDYYGKPGLQVGDLLKPGYQAFVREVEKGVAGLEASTTAFMTDMLRFGPSKYDIAVTYENLAMGEIGNADGRWGKLHVYYPGTTLWSDHPTEVLDAPWITEPQRAAGRAFIAHLRSRPMQELAITCGFRPADPTVPMRTAGAENPFTRLADRGVKLELAPMAPVPSSELVKTMLQMWGRVVAR